MQFIEYKGISINKFSDKIGTSNSYFNKVFKNNTSIGSDKIEKILRTYPELSPSWLFLEKGDMIISEGNYDINNEIKIISEPENFYHNADKLADYIIENTEDLLKNKKFNTWYDNIFLKGRIEGLKEYIRNNFEKVSK
ncbi:helix-turn-helix transcriptional regulator [Flavobacterium sp. NRK1]|nr:helix-turn-helix transcriptional regulator [Flavobacterium sp. NRK1]